MGFSQQYRERIGPRSLGFALATSVILAMGSDRPPASASPQPGASHSIAPVRSVLVEGDLDYRTRVRRALGLLEARCPQVHAALITHVEVIADSACGAQSRGCRCDIFVLPPEIAAESPAWVAGTIAREGYVRAMRGVLDADTPSEAGIAASGRIEQAGDVVRVSVLRALRASAREIEWASQLASPIADGETGRHLGRN